MNTPEYIFRIMKKCWLSAVMVFAFLIIAAPLKAASVSGDVTIAGKVQDSVQFGSYSAVLYDINNGLPNSAVLDCVQTEDGFIWLGSYSGLIRYDGTSFYRMDSKVTGIGSVIKLFTDSRGRLWMGTNESGLAVFESRGLKRWTQEDGLLSDKVYWIEETSDGIFYAGTAGGISMILPDLSIRNIDDPRINDQAVTRIMKGEDDQLYCSSSEDDFFVIKDGEITEFYPHENNSIGDIISFMPDMYHPGNCYFGTTESTLYYGSLKTDKKEMKTIDISPLNEVTDIREINGRIWICARNGIGELDRDGSFYQINNLPMQDLIEHVTVDYEGNLWFTSSRHGLMKITWNRFSNLNNEAGLPPGVVNTTCLHDEDLYIGTDTGLMAVNQEGPVSDIPVTKVNSSSGDKYDTDNLIELLDGCRIRSIIEDREGRLWICIWRKLGLVCYDHGEVTIYGERDGLPTDHVRAVDERPDGSILVACTGGVSVVRDGKVTATYGREQGLTNPECLAVSNGEGNDILVATSGGGIFIINEDDGAVRNIGTKEGLTSEVVMRIKHDPAREIYWIITSNSIAWMTKDYEVHTVDSFLLTNNLDMFENSRGEMWILSGDGIYVAKTQDMIDNKEVKKVFYGVSNGLPCIATSNSYSAITNTKTLYIAGTSCVIKVNIDSTYQGIKNIKQNVSHIEADGVRYYPDKNGAFTIPADTKKLTIYAFVFNYTLDDPNLTYYLEGFDRKPIEVDVKDLAPLTYTNLKGGEYRFVMELNDDLGGKSQKLVVPIIKEKGLFEQTWFLVVVALVCLLLISGLNYEINHQITKRRQEAKRREAEEERIANELLMASQIQGSALPHNFPPFPNRHEFELYASMNPAREVGGDFYDYFFIDDDHLCLVIADVSDKGIPAAMFMMASKSTIASQAMEGGSPAEILKEANNTIASSNTEKLFVTVWLGIFEISTGKLTATNAGHLYPAVKHGSGDFELYKDKHGLVVGLMKGMTYTDYEIMLEPGSKIFVYTDGVNEAMRSDRQQYGTDRMIDALNIDSNAAPEQLLRNVRNDMNEFIEEAEQFDDITMLCFEYKGV